MTNEEFKELALSKVNPGPFKPVAIYNNRDDSLEILITSESYRRERVDKFFTVYSGRKSEEVVGAMIKGVRHFLNTSKQCPDAVLLEVHDGKVKVAHIFRSIREELKGKQVRKRTIINLVIEKLEEVADDLEANVGSLVPCL